MPLIVKGFYEQRQAIIDNVLSTGVPTQHDVYYVQSIRAEIERNRRMDDLRKTVPELPPKINDLATLEKV